MANSNGWGDGAANNSIGWGQGANNAIGWGDSHAKSWAGLTDIVGLTTDPDAQAFITAAAITDPTQQAAIDNLVKGLKSDNIWTKMKAIYPFVGGTASTHKWNLKDPRDLDAAFRLVFNGGWSHSSTGAQGNGVNTWVDTKLNVNNVLDGTNSHLSYYSRTIATAASGQDYYMMGAYNAPTDAFYAIDMNSTNPNMYSALGSIANATNVNATNSRGYFIAKKETNNNQKAIKNNVILDTKVQPSTNKPSFNVGLNVLNFNNGLYGYSPFECAFATIGDGLTDTEAANLYTRVQSYQTALSRNV